MSVVVDGSMVKVEAKGSCNVGVVLGFIDE